MDPFFLCILLPFTTMQIICLQTDISASCTGYLTVYPLIHVAYDIYFRREILKGITFVFGRCRLGFGRTRI
ncbi:uncharacterized protein GGS22DRAFT_154786 [Annulohypoxylon maeteangense]|uniref:uncharacterized protein n=1 Tax=Annulohypoxylon maeteangense TaxID=1927788 RepID=UPI002008450F|nr:uncharacterized protein GGS22DRAFT_154786 [Annulohypoxylon maeteangense]KAI0888002.1 hypothetical protein GGS22DRAFT_154786 [Annulohypoxylon maeteangense]